MFRRWNLRGKIILIAFLVTCVPFFIGSVVLVRHMYQTFTIQVNTYSHYSIQVLGRSIEQFLETGNNVSLYAIINPQIIRYLNTERADVAQEAYEQHESEAVQALAFLPYTAPGVHYTVVQTMDGRMVSNGPGYYVATAAEIQAAVALEGKPVWNVEAYTDRMASITVCRLIRDSFRLSRHLGVVKVYIDLPTVREQLAALPDLPAAENYIVDGDGGILVRPMADGLASIDKIDPTALDRALAGQGTVPLTLGGVQYHVSAYPLSSSGWYAVSLLPNAYRADNLTQFGRIMLTSFVLFCLAAISLSIIFSHLIVKPIRDISGLMESVAGEDFSVRTSVQGSNEITLLQQRFNAMSERLEKLYGEVYLYNLRLKDAQIKALQSQINPHFLYNTLDSVYWMSELRGMHDVSHMVSSLSQLFRISLKVDAQGFISVAEEWQHAVCYISIQQVRFQDSIRFELSCDESLGKATSIALILQPLVENAILHGVEPTGQGVIYVSVFREESTLVFAVRDTGVGVEEAMVRALLLPAENETGTKGLALRSIHDRITMKYGPPYGLTFRRLPEGGSLFRVTQPLREVHDA